MVNSKEFIKRIEHILKYYELTASSFADKIQVQRSSISHLLSGRNKPSLEFVLKVTSTFPEVNLYWLLKGQGSFPNTAETTLEKPEANLPPTPKVDTKKEKSIVEEFSKDKNIERVIIFYNDGSFKSYE